jgi:hypothetical protein
MPINPQIPLAVNPPAPIANPLQTLRDVMTVKDEQMQHQQRIQIASDEAAVREALAAHPDDIDEAIGALSRSGHGPAALKLREVAIKQREAVADALKKHLDVETAQLAYGTQIVQGVRDQGSLTTAKRLLGALNPDVAAQLPDTWDDVETPKAVEYLRSIGMKASEYNTVQHNALTLARDAAKDAPNTVAKWMEAIGTTLSATSTDELWQQNLNAFKELGAPKKVLEMFAPTYSPASATQAGDLAMTPTQRASAKVSELNAQTAVTNAETSQQRARTAAAREGRIAREGTGGTGGSGKAGGVTIAQRNQAERWKQAQLDRLEAEFKEKVDEVPEGKERSDKEQVTYDKAVRALEAAKLRIENSFRSQIGLSAHRTLPAEWGGSAAPTATPAPAAPPAQKAGGGNIVTVKAPNGKAYTFPTQAAADAFKKAAGIQ